MDEKLLITLAQESDAREVFGLSNDPVVRANSTNSGSIGWSEHILWFNKAISDENVKFYIVRTCQNEFVGQVRFRKEASSWVVSVSVAPSFRGKKLAPSILRDAMAVSGESSFLAYIKASNGPSMASFERAGFMKIGEEDLNDVLHFIYRHER